MRQTNVEMLQLLQENRATFAFFGGCNFPFDLHRSLMKSSGDSVWIF